MTLKIIFRQEEPSATAMDISTGHMVLSYMEDHLKNKHRLEQEWVGLCAYEAEPNSTAIAFKVVIIVIMAMVMMMMKLIMMVMVVMVVMVVDMMGDVCDE